MNERITSILLSILHACAVAGIGLIAVNIILKILNKAFNQIKGLDVTITRFLRSLLKFVLYFIVILSVANDLGIDTRSLVALASVFSAAIALAGQNILTNLFGGISLLINHPFKVDDYIETGTIQGIVKEIGMFYTVLVSFDNKRIVIPNGNVSSATLINYSTEEKRRVDINVSVSYDCQLNDVKKAISSAISRTANILDQPSFIRVSEYASSAIVYSVKVWCHCKDYWNVYYDLLENIKICFDEDNIQMTYNHIIVHQDKES